MQHDDEPQKWKYTNAELNYDPAGNIDWNETSRIALIRCYLEAKLWLARNELANAQTLFRIESNPYTAGRLSWAKHKVASIKQLKDDAINPYKTIDRYRRWLEKQGELQCQKTLQESQPTSPEACDCSASTYTVSAPQRKTKSGRRKSTFSLD